MPRVVLDAGAGPGLAKHLQVEVGPLPEPLGLEQPARVLELGDALHQLGLDVLDRLEQLLAGRSRTSDRKSTRLNSSHGYISYAVFCLKKKKKHIPVGADLRKKFENDIVSSITHLPVRSPSNLPSTVNTLESS